MAGGAHSSKVKHEEWAHGDFLDTKCPHHVNCEGVMYESSAIGKLRPMRVAVPRQVLR